MKIPAAAPSSTAPSSPSRNRRWGRERSGSAPTTATCRSRATTARRGRKSARTCRASRRRTSTSAASSRRTTRAARATSSVDGHEAGALQAVRVQDDRLRQDVDEHQQQPAGDGAGLRREGRSQEPEPAVRGDGVRGVLFRRRREEVGEVEQQHADGRRPRPADPSARQRSRSPRRTGAGCGSWTTSRRCSSCRTR